MTDALPTWVQSSDKQDLSVEPLPGVVLEKTSAHVVCRFRERRDVLSSAVLGGGFSQADQFVNLKVDANDSGTTLTPQQSLVAYCEGHGWHGQTIGMMTAASMNSLRYGIIEAEDTRLLLLLTCGLANARRAGDAADVCASDEPARQTGTINIAVVSEARFCDAALVELMMMATEAKCAALQSAGVNSPVSGQIATGTGTDSIALFNGLPSPGTEIQYCGKHTRLGEVFAQCLIDLLTDSFAEDRLFKEA